MMRWLWVAVFVVFVPLGDLRSAEPDWRDLADPVVERTWLRPPASEEAAKPVWGFAEGLRIGLSPLPGPRGLLRVYAPYAGQPEWRMINFIAIEPIVEGQTRRGYSELEPSSLAEGRGKVMWSMDRPGDWTAHNPAHPARGVIKDVNDVETLTVYIGVEKFHGGAAVFLRLTFRADQPHEVEVATFRQPDSAALAACVVTATMGNYARLRRLHLADRTVDARGLLAGATFNALGFSSHMRFGVDELARTPHGAAVLLVTSDERDPAAADQSGVGPGWRYIGRPVTQYWRCDRPGPELAAMVNARRTYWVSNTPIPGGVSFENVELVAPFEDGQSWTFGVTPDPPALLVDAE